MLNQPMNYSLQYPYDNPYENPYDFQGQYPMQYHQYPQYPMQYPQYPQYPMNSGMGVGMGGMGGSRSNNNNNIIPSGPIIIKNCRSSCQNTSNETSKKYETNLSFKKDSNNFNECLRIEFSTCEKGCIPAEEFELYLLIKNNDPRIDEYENNSNFHMKFTDNIHNNSHEFSHEESVNIIEIMKTDVTGDIKSVLFKESDTIVSFMNRLKERLSMYKAIYDGDVAIPVNLKSQYDQLREIKRKMNIGKGSEVYVMKNTGKEDNSNSNNNEFGKTLNKSVKKKLRKKKLEEIPIDNNPIDNPIKKLHKKQRKMSRKKPQEKLHKKSLKKLHKKSKKKIISLNVSSKVS